MPNNLKEGPCIITCLMEGTGKLGVNWTRPASQSVVTNAPVTEWEVKKVDGKDNIHLLSVGGYDFTFYDGSTVTASTLEDQSQEWYISYQDSQDAYLIQFQYGAGLGWFTDDQTDTSIKMNTVIGPLIYPPQFLPAYLFRFEFLD